MDIQSGLNMDISFRPPPSLNKRFTYEWKKSIGPVLYVRMGDKRIGLCVCHHRKDRAVRFFGLENYLCSRDLGILFGYIAGFIVLFAGFTLSFPLALLLMAPMIIDGTTQLFGKRESNNYLRLVTGFLFGFSLSLFIGGLLFGRG